MSKSSSGARLALALGFVLLATPLIGLSVTHPQAAADRSVKPNPAAKSEGKAVRLKGFITDEWCGKANANPKGADCARSCAKKGSDLAIYANGKIYKLSDKKAALEHLGYEVIVTGKLDRDGTVLVASIEKAKAQLESD